MGKNSINVKHPGQYLLEEIEKAGMSQKELAIRTGSTEKHISTVVNGAKPISTAFAKKLGYALEQSPDYWLKLQAKYDMEVLKFNEEKGITPQEQEIFKILKDVYDYMLKKNLSKYIETVKAVSQKVIQLREVLNISNLEDIPKIGYNAAYRAQVRKNSKVDPYVLFAWQRVCELQAEKAREKLDIAEFDKNKLLENIPTIKTLIATESDRINYVLKELTLLFAKCGIIFCVVHHFKGAPVQGFIKQTDDNKVLLCLTIRGGAADRFWFTLFHEIGHIVNGDLNVRFVDFDSVSNEMEEKADKFAVDTLIPAELFDNFVKSRLYDRWEYIERCAEKANVPPIIVLGRLRKEEYLLWSDFTEHNVMYKWAE